MKEALEQASNKMRMSSLMQTGFVSIDDGPSHLRGFNDVGVGRSKVGNAELLKFPTCSCTCMSISFRFGTFKC